ncbi:unnamed protein product [Paramecium pentaurelia]|uniref:Schlafen AlbA-2 domain-containing protein n=1 Tax=Paramecium pentaurelia TaxID=43138 RepID=A0A8S1S5E2_9CILI|nr:unnamed protein product [Paramecium pentaurelia]
MKEKFYHAFKNELDLIQKLQLNPLFKQITIWTDHLLENQQLTEQEKLLQELSNNQDHFKKLLQDCCNNLEEQNLSLLCLLSLVFGLIVPIELIEEENLAYIIERYYIQHSNSIKLLITLFSKFKFNNILVLLPLVHDQEIIQLVQSIKINLFDKTYISIYDLIENYTQNKDQEYFDQIIKLSSDLDIYSSNQLHIQLIQQIKKFIEYESNELVQKFVDIELNDYYESVPLFKDIKVVRSKEDLLNRKLFIQNEFIHVPEDETIEYKEMINLEAKNKFIVKKAVTAFMNQKGGTLFIGIKDSQEVRGFNVGSNIYYFRQCILDECLDMIHPTLIFEKQVKVDLIPIYSYEGIEIEGHFIIKIELTRELNCPYVYTFGELIEHHQQCEVTFCFKRQGDQSKAVRHHHLKQLIKILNLNQNIISSERIGREYFIDNRIKNRKYINQSSKERGDSNQLQYKQDLRMNQHLLKEIESNENIDKNLEPHPDIDLANLNLQINSQLNQVQQWQHWVVIRKLKSNDFDRLINILTTYQDVCIQDIIIASTTIHIQLKNLSKEEFIENLKYHFNRQGERIKFTYGYPQVIQIAQQNIDIEQIISDNLKLHNFQIHVKKECKIIEAKHVEDLIQIYKFIKEKIKIEVHWKLKEPQEFIFAAIDESSNLLN